jgi:alpha-tubulin suppressor-like RCC1 family protein
MHKNLTAMLAGLLLVSLIFFSTPSHPVGAAVSVQFAVGSYHTCALKQTSVWCWGLNYYGQLGDGTKVDKKGAVQVLDAARKPFTAVTKISSSRGSTTFGGGDRDYVGSTCAIKATEVWCWGNNDFKQLGSTTLSASTSTFPVLVTKSNRTRLNSVIDVQVGGRHACALTSGKTVWCWGANDYGQLGIGTTPSYPPKTGAFQVKKTTSTFLTNVTAVTASQNFTCALSAGTVWCWGVNFSGQLGIGNKTNKMYATQVKKLDGSPLTGVSSISAGFSHVCATNTTGAWCWGSNSFGQALNNDINHADLTKATPAVYTDGSRIPANVIISTPDFKTCFTNSGMLWCTSMGTLSLSQVMYADNSPMAIDGVLSSGGNTFCATLRSIPMCWGVNEFGQVGDRSTTYRMYPVRVKYNSGAVFP